MQHLDLMRFLAVERINRIEDDFRRAAAPPRVEPPELDERRFELRLCTVHDDPALERLAELEGRTLAAGRYVLAELDGALVAAQPLAGGEPYADPFRATAELLPLLRLRAEQIARPAKPPHRLSPRRHWSLIRGSIHA